MPETTADAALRSGVPVQVHAYIAPNPGTLPVGCRLENAPDASTLRVRDGKVVELVRSGDAGAAMRADHVYHQPPGTEQDGMERTLQPMVKAAVEGVNTAVLAIGSLRSTKSDVLWKRTSQQSLAETVFLAVLAALEAKAAAFERGTGRNRFSSSLCVSFVEFYEETITDLLCGASGSPQATMPTVDTGTNAFAQLKDVIRSPALRSPDAFRRLLESGRQARRTDVGLYGNAVEFSSAVLRIHLTQVFEIENTPTQGLLSTLDIVDLPPTDRLNNLSGAMPRLAEGPLLNKSLFAVSDCISSFSESVGGMGVQPPFNESSFTQFLRDSLSGNCLSFSIVFLVSNDATGTRGSIQLGNKMHGVRTFPVVNNDVIRGLHIVHFNEIRALKRREAIIQADGRYLTSRNGDGAFVGRIHELEGRVAQEVLEKKMIREDKDKIAAVMNELKAKYQQLFDNEIEIRKELLTCEQEKLALSKAFVEFQMEKNAQVQDLDNEKFELESKLIQAEEMVVQLQHDDAMKASQIQDLCRKINEVITEKRELGEQLALLQKHSQDLERKVSQEAKKNQQLSLEFVVLVNQRQKALVDMEGFEQRHRDLTRELSEKVRQEGQLRTDLDKQKEHIVSLESSLEATRKDLVRKEIDIERLHVQTEKAKLEFEKKSDFVSKERETETERTLTKATASIAVLTHEKALLTQQLQRAHEELEKKAKETDKNFAAWMAKSHENEDLIVSNERLRQEIQTQLDDFRLKLSLVSSANDGGSVATTELIQSYQRRERELRAQNALNHKRLTRLKKQLASTSVIDNTEVPANDVPDTSLLEGELTDLNERLHETELEVVKQLEIGKKAREDSAQLQQIIASLREENEQLRNQLKSSRASEQGNLETTNTLQTMILQQLGEIRKLSVQPTVTHHPMKPPTPQLMSRKELEVQSLEVQELIRAKKQLEESLASNQSEWMQSVEDAERRCAGLMTKNVMLSEENEQLQNTLKSLLTRLHARR